MVQITPTDGGRQIVALAIAVTALLAGGAGRAQAATTGAYPNAAPMAQYRIAAPTEEIALARSAAPPSIADKAAVMTLGEHGYEIAAKGTNGFVCLVERSWGAGFDDAEFWNPKIRGPMCFNPAAVRSVMPTYLDRTTWVLAGATRAELVKRTKAGIAAGRIRAPDAGAMGLMLSKGGFLGDAAGGHWHPHLMIFLPRGAGGSPADWGANLPGSPVLGGDKDLDPAAVYFVPLTKWSDGTSATMEM